MGDDALKSALNLIKVRIESMDIRKRLAKVEMGITGVGADRH